MSHRTLIVAFGFATLMIHLAKRPTPTVHERVRSNRARRYAAAKRNIRSI